MNSFIWPSNFTSTLVTENTIFPNLYNLSICIEPIETKYNINLGIKKIKYFIENSLDNNIFINLSNPILSSLDKIKNTKIIFPNEPYDFTVGSLLFLKFVTISKKYFDINYLTLSSTIGDNIQYTIFNSDTYDSDSFDNYWWKIDSPFAELNNKISWEDLDIRDNNQFSPRIINGGLRK